MSTSNYKVIYEAKSEINIVEEGLLDSVGNLIKKAIEKIKDFFKYIRDKIKEIWKKLTKKKNENEKSKTNENYVPIEKRIVEVEITGYFDIENVGEVEYLKKLVKEAFEQELDQVRNFNNLERKYNYHNLDLENGPKQKLKQMHRELDSTIVKKTFFGNKIDDYLKSIEKANQLIKFFEETSVSALNECEKIIEAGKNSVFSNKFDKDMQEVRNKITKPILRFIKDMALNIVNTVNKHSNIIKILKDRPDNFANLHQIKVINKNF